MNEYIAPFIAVIVTLLFVGSVASLVLNSSWRKGKRWFSGFIDIHLTRENGEVKLTAKVKDQGGQSEPVKKFDVRNEP